MLRGGSGGLLGLLSSHSPTGFLRRGRIVCKSKMSTEISPECPKFVSLRDGDACSSSDFRFRVVSYNILAQVYVKSSFFPHSPPPCLRWKARSNAILKVFDNLQADFLCLQELDNYESFYKAKLEGSGYSSIYLKRTGQKRDGCGIFYKHGSAELISKEEIKYNDLVDMLGNVSLEDENENTDGLRVNKSKGISGKGMQKFCPDVQEDASDSRVRLMRDCVGILAVFKLKCPSQHIVIVANTHIYWDPDWADVKLAQVEHLLYCVSDFKKKVSKKYNCIPSVIIAGDFNSTPGDKVYQCVTSDNKIGLSSIYASVGAEPPFTNYTPDFTGTLDYIFFSKAGELRPISLLEIPGPDCPHINGGLPNYHHPSDHLPIGGYTNKKRGYADICFFRFIKPKNYSSSEYSFQDPSPRAKFGACSCHLCTLLCKLL